MNESEQQADNSAQPTRAGCVLALLSAAALLGAAVPIVSWRDPETGQPLPRLVAIIATVCVGAVCYGVGAALLRGLGFAVWKQPDSDTTRPPSE